MTMSVDAFATTAEFFINRLLDKIGDYYCMNGEMPKSILATTKSYWLIENYATRFFTLREENSQPAPYFRGIEVRIVSGGGYEFFLVGEPITLRE